METIVVGGGCFWCVEAVFKELRGVEAVESGYAGGHRPNPTYEQVCSGVSGHAEVVKVTYDPAVISRDDLFRLFFVAHDPTQLNRQGGDVGTQYRSVIFYRDDEEKAAAERIRDEIAAEEVYAESIVTTFEPLTNYARAEEYHQDYYAKFESAGFLEQMRMNAGYCRAVVGPKVSKFRQKYASLLKSPVGA